MSVRTIGVVMNGVTGRMGHHQHLGVSREAFEPQAHRGGHRANAHDGCLVDRAWRQKLKASVRPLVVVVPNVLVQNALGARRAGAFDVNAACSGFVYALAVADFAKLLGEETEKWAQVVKFSGLKAE